MKKIILFDFDGTIADTLLPALNILNGYLKENGYQRITADDLKKLRHMNPLQIVSHFKFPIWKLPALVKHVRDELSKHVEEIRIFPGVDKLIRDFKKNHYLLAVLSSNSQETIDRFLEFNKINVFNYVKCEPNILEKAKLLKKFLKDNRLSPSEVIYIGDEVRDIEACKNVGIQIISVSWGFNDAVSLRKMKPDFLVKKPTEIFNLLKEM